MNKRTLFGIGAGVITAYGLYEYGKSSAPAYPELGVGGWPILLGISVGVGYLVYRFVR